MTRLLALASLSVLLLVRPAPAGQEPSLLHHDLDVIVEPEAGRVVATDRLRVPRAMRPDEGPLEVALHADLELQTAEEEWSVAPVADSAKERGGAPSRLWHVSPASGAWPEGDVTIGLSYSGRIQHPLEQEAEEYARSFSRTVGTIGEEGVVLTRASWWVPSIGEETLTFRLRVSVPEGWDAVSQGTRTAAEEIESARRVTWDCPHPMEEVYLIAGRWTEYDRRVGPVLAQAFLREPDEALASRYLEATDAYVGMYARLIGPYPFGKFALVENFWETGYGMPSFTLLGPRVIRFPFILHSSYPHEILHNWWGNSVYVDWQTGNWCEGLTAYMADHLIKEGQGQGAVYRRDTLKKYRSYVKDGRDFPLTDFHSRHSSATEAVGYGKALMVFHMMRRGIGDDTFRVALSAFYRRNLWEQASWSDLAKAFSDTAGTDLSDWIETWTTRPGAPALAADVEPRPGQVEVTLRQTQDGEAWPIDVPVALTVLGEEAAKIVVVPMTEKSASVTIDVPAPVVRVDVDPEFDVFRRLDLPETPPTLGEVFGADRVTIVVPAAGKDPLAAAWSNFARAWQRGGARGDVTIVPEDALEALPTDRAVWILGARNAWAKNLGPALVAYGAGPEGDTFLLGEDRVPRAGHGVVVVTRHPANEELAVGWVSSDVEASLPGLARKLPHYGKYSYLAFEGDEPTNVEKGEWPPAGSPMTIHLTGTQHPRGTLPERQPLARPEPLFDAGRLMTHVRALADDAMEGRGVGTAGLEKAADYVAQAFEQAGLEPGGSDGGFFQTFEVPDGPDGDPVTLKNVVGFVPGRDPQLAGRPVVIGAHYDHLGYGWPDVRTGHEGKIHNGADDNASGVAVLIELARRLAEGPRPARSLVFLAFSGEEWGLKGSRYVASHAFRWPLDDALAMINLDTVGRLGEGPLLVLGAGGATEWPHIVRGVGFTTGIAARAVTDDPEGSDQVAFREIGVPAVQLFTGGHEDYHRSTDDVEKIDAEGLVKVATWARETIAYLGDRPDPLTKTGGETAAPERGAGPRGARKVILGTVPVFDHVGEGVLVDSVVPGSPAEKAGLRGGDLLLAIDEEPTTDLRVYGRILRRHEAGDVIRIRIRRDGEEQVIEATLDTR